MVALSNLAWAPGSVIDSRYEIVDRLGSGGMATVFKVRDREKDEIIALKMLHQHERSDLFVTRFQREFLTLHKLNHPNIVRVFDFKRSRAGPYYFTMEYLAGVDLSKIGPNTDFDLLLRLVIKILHTLQFIHTKGLVHGDIKPHNIIYGESDESVTLTDFGMVEEINLGRRGPVQGTVNYMSPEIIRGSRLDQRSDIYSLGIMLYELLCGTVPFSAAEPLTVLRMHLEKSPPPLRQMKKPHSDFLSRITMKCLEKKPLERYQSVEEIMRELARHDPRLLSDESVALRESYILSPEFVGRKNEMSFLIQLLELSIGGKGQAIIVNGETGIGKSRLVNEFKVHCQMEGYTVLTTHCQEKASRPHQPIVDFCQQLIGASGSDERPFLRDHAAELRKLSIDLPLDDLISAEELEALFDDPSVERTRFYDALTQLFIDISQTLPLVIIIEELHWVDQVTLGIIRYLVRNLGSANILICGTYLTEAAFSSALLGKKEEIEAMLDENAANPHFHILSLENLKPGDVASMVGSQLGMAFKPEEFGKRLHKSTSGNPFIITEIMKQLVNENIIFRQKGEWVINIADTSLFDIPLSVREILQKRLHGISPATKTLLEYFSVPQKGIEFPLLFEWTGKNETILFENLYELLNRDIITQTENYYELVYPALRKIIYEHIPLERKVRLHAEYGSLLEAHNPQSEMVVSELAHHYVKGNVREKALQYSIFAAEISGRVYAHEQAAEHYERAVNLAGNDDYAMRMNLLRTLVDLSMMSGNYSQAIDRLNELSGLNMKYNLFSVQDICSLNRKMAGIYQKTGEYHKALKYLYDSLNLLEGDTDNFIVAQIHTNLGNIYMLLGDYEKALAHCHISYEIVEPLDSLKEISEIYNTYGKIYVRIRSYNKAQQYFTKSLQLREKIGDTLGIGRTYANLGVISDEINKPQEGEDFYMSALKIFEKIGFIYGCATIYNNLGLLFHQHKTDWEQSISYLFKATELHERSGNSFGEAYTNWNLGLVYRDIGDIKTALFHSRRALSIFQQLNNQHLAVNVQISIAGLLLEKGELKSARYTLEECLRLAETMQREDELQAAIYYELARYYHIDQQNEKALSLCQQARILAKKMDDHETESMAWFLEALLQREKNDTVEQESALLESLRIIEHGGPIFLVARINWELGQLYHELHNDQKALEYVEKARTVFQKIGVRSFYEKAQDLLSSMRERILPDLFKLKGDHSEIATLYRISHDINSTLDLPTLLEKILDAAIKTARAERGLLILYDKSREKYSVKVARNMDRKTSDDMATVSGGVVDRAVRQGIPILSSDARLDPRFKENQSVILFDIKSILCVPLKIKGKTVGALYFDNRAISHQFSEKDMDFMVVLANQAAISIDNALLFERHRSAADNLNVGIVVMSNRGFITSCNSKAAQILEMNTIDLIGTFCSPVMEKDGLEQIAAILLKSSRNKTVTEVEMRVQCPTGTLKTIDISTSLIFDAFGEMSGVMGIFRDITRDRTLQEELKLQRRLNAIGDLATKISQRLNHYLKGIKHLSRKLDEKLDVADLKREYIEEIMLEVAEAEKYIIHELSPQESGQEEKQNVDLNTLVKDICNSLSAETQGRLINMKLECSAGAPCVAVDPIQLREVVNNIIRNAIQAVGEGGTVSIQTGYDSESVFVHIQDDGPGIPDDMKQKIFEPFYTTKEEGSGVGLWIAHRIITSFNGRIRLTSESGQGTCFTIQIPGVQPGASSPVTRSSGSESGV